MERLVEQEFKKTMRNPDVSKALQEHMAKKVKGYIRNATIRNRYS